MKVVIDTNVFVSAVLGGISSKVLDLLKSGTFILVVTTDIINEYLSVLSRSKFNLPQVVIDDIVLYIYEKSIFVSPTETINLIVDESDNRFLEAAITANVDFIVSGDKHLLNLGKYKGIKIIKVKEFLDMLK